MYKTPNPIILRKNWKSFNYSFPVRDFLNKTECEWLIDEFHNPNNDFKIREEREYHLKKSFEGDEKKYWRICDIKWMKYYGRNFEWLFDDSVFWLSVF